MTGSIFDNKDLDLAIELHQSAEQIAGIGSYEVRLASGEMICSDNLCRLLGRQKPAARCTLDDFLAVIYPDDKKRVQQQFEIMLADQAPFEIEFQAVREDGMVRVFHQKCKILIKQDGSSSIVGIVQDVTERKQDEFRLHEQAHFINKVAETAPDLISVFNLLERRLEYINHKNAEVYGYTDDEMMNMDPAKRHELVHTDDRDIVKEYFTRLAAETSEAAHVAEYRATNKDGSVQWFRTSGKVFRRDQFGVPTHCLNVIHNITDRKLAEALLRKNEALLKEAERIASMGSWERDVKTNGLLWSDELYRLYGLEPSAVPPSSEYFLLHIVHPDDKDVAIGHIQSLWNGNTDPVEYRILRPGGEERWVYVKAQMEYNSDGSLAFIRGISSDITLQKKAEQELRNLNKALVRKNRELQNLNSELTNFANVTGQDLKEPLRKVYSFLEMIANKDNDRLSEAGRGGLKKAQAMLQRMSLLTDDIIAFTEVSNHKEARSKVDLNLVVAYVTKQLKDKIDRSTAVIDKTALPVVKGYRTLLSNLFYHLLDNAIRFNEDGNGPHIRIAAGTVKGVEINNTDAVEEGDYTRLEFRDNGLAFSAKDTEQVFAVFSHAGSKGKNRRTGVGLAICKKIVDKHHGFITATDAEDGGVVFTVYLPA